MTRCHAPTLPSRSARAGRPARRLRACLCLCLLWVLALLAHPAPSSALLKGVFEDCSLEHMATCVQRLEMARQMGFRMVLNQTATADPTLARTYALAAQQRGLLVGWGLSNEAWWAAHRAEASNVLTYYPGWTRACGCRSNGALLNYVVRYLASLPSTWGWYIADDTGLRVGDETAMRNWNGRLKRLAPTKKTVIGIYHPRDLRRYRGAADFLAQQSYPFGLHNSAELRRNTPRLARYTEARTRRSAFILQAFTWGENVWGALNVGRCGLMTKATCMESLPYPTTSEMRWQKRTILQNARPRLLLWFGLHNTLGFVPRLEDPDQNHNQPTPAEAIVRAQRLGLAVRGKAGGTSRRNSAPKKRKGKRGAGRHGSGVGRGGSGR